MSEQEKQCRICLDGIDAEGELGRLIRPCLCKGSISYVHVKCLERWRNTSSSKSAFFACPQCHYQYRFARTRIVGLATNPIIVGGISGLLFAILVMLASFVTTLFMPAFEHLGYYTWYYVSPFEVARDLVTAAFRVIRDGQLGDVLEDDFVSQKGPLGETSVIHTQPGIIRWFIRRFILGLPLIGAGSLVHLFLSAPFLGPIQWLARYRGSRSRRNRNTQDIAAVIVIGLLIMGALRALYHVYGFTKTLTQRVLLRAEDVILEVS